MRPPVGGLFHYRPSELAYFGQYQGFGTGLIPTSVASLILAVA